MGQNKTCTITNAQVTGRIAPTQTTCQEFRSGTSGDLTDELYVVKGNKINGISPGVFFYYNKITVPSGGITSLQVKQTQSLSPVWTTIGTMQVILWDANCVKTSVTGSANNGTVTFSPANAVTSLTPGDYYISIKYDPGTLVGQTVNGNPKPTNTYTFTTWINGSAVPTSSDSVNVRPK